MQLHICPGHALLCAFVQEYATVVDGALAPKLFLLKELFEPVLALDSVEMACDAGCYEVCVEGQ